jgi:hypothetical protein
MEAIMARKTGGEMVKAGLYWNVKEWDATIAPPEGCVLPGDGSMTYYKLPLPAMLVIAPLMGAAYAFFLPFIGFAMLAMFLGRYIRRMFTTARTAAGEAVPPRKTV